MTNKYEKSTQLTEFSKSTYTNGFGIYGIP